MHIEKIYDLGEVKEITKYCPGNYGAPGRGRAPKEKETTERAKKQNRRNQVRFMQRLLIANFWEGGWHLVLTYRKELMPADIEGAKKKVRKFLDSMRESYKKAGHEFKYICVSEVGSRGAAHHHVVIEDIATEKLSTKKMVAQFWVNGSQHFTPLRQEGEYKELAEYLVKDKGKDGQRCRYTRSRNLLVPEPKREKVYGQKIKGEPEPEEGWYVIKGTLESGLNPATGLPYQRYMVRSLEKREVPQGGGSQDIRGKLMEKPGKAGWGGDVARRVQKAWQAKAQGRVHTPGSGDRGTGHIDGTDKCGLHPENALPDKNKPGVRACVGRCAKRLVSAVEGKRLEKRQGEAGKKCRALGTVRRKSRAARPCGGKRGPWAHVCDAGFRGKRNGRLGKEEKNAGKAHKH